MTKITKVTENALRSGADVMVASIDAQLFGGYPILAMSWVLFKTYYASTLEHRSERAEEFLEIIRDNPNEFIQEIVSSTKFQDDFVKMLREYLITSNDQKRAILREVFLGNVSADEEFPLERIISVTQQLTQKDIDTFRHVDVNRFDLNYRIFEGKATNDQIYSIYNLLGLGLLTTPDTARLASDGIHEQFVIVTPFGKIYRNYICGMSEVTQK